MSVESNMALSKAYTSRFSVLFISILIRYLSVKGILALCWWPPQSFLKKAYIQYILTITPFYSCHSGSSQTSPSTSSSQLHTVVRFLPPLSPTRAVHAGMGVRPSAGAWETYQWPLTQEKRFFPPQELSATNSSSGGRRTLELIPSCWWSLNWTDLGHLGADKHSCCVFMRARAMS